MIQRLIGIALIFSLLGMALGHFGATELDWHRDPISTFAARAPLHKFVTGSMILAALAIFLLGCDIAIGPKRQPTFIYGVVACLAGASAAGLLTVALFKEPVQWTLPHPSPTEDQVRVQAFHDCGLMLFFYGSAVTLMLLSGIWIAGSRNIRRLFGILPFTFVVAAKWGVYYIPLAGNSGGIRQRITMLLLWCGLASYAFLLRKNQRNGPQEVGTTSQA